MTVLASIQVGTPRTLGNEDATDPFDREWTTAFFKEPVAGPVHVGETNLAGDAQADLSVHGGRDKAICVYSAEHYPHWRADLARLDLPFGAFGENFTVSGLVEDAVCIGDEWRIGDVRLQVSQPRQPCWKLARRWKVRDLPKRVVATGFTGWYFRVLTTGAVEAGRELVLEDRPHPGWNVKRANEVMHGQRKDTAAAAALAAVPLLSSNWRETLERRAGNAPG